MMSPPCPLATMAAHLPRPPVIAFLSLVFLVVHVPASHGSSSDSLPPTYDSSMCPESFSCGGVDFHYPFYLSNTTRYTANYTPYSCGYTDLEIFCQGEGPTWTPVIRLGGDTYTVLNIIYDNKTIVLADSDVLGPVKCPAVSHDVSFDKLWLRLNPGSNENLTFYFGCKSLDRVPPVLDTYRIDCTGFKNGFGDGPSFIFTPDDHDPAQEPELAALCYKLSVPVMGEAPATMNRTNFTHGGYGDMLKQGFELVWLSNSTHDECLPCEQSGGKCAYSEYREFNGCLCSEGKVLPSMCPSPLCARATLLLNTRWVRFCRLFAGATAVRAQTVYHDGSVLIADFAWHTAVFLFPVICRHVPLLCRPNLPRSPPVTPRDKTGGYQPKRRNEQKETHFPWLSRFATACCCRRFYLPSWSPLAAAMILPTQAYTCGKVEIRYPFYLSGVTGDVRNHSNSYCGYPGLAIACEDGGEPTLSLGNRDYNVTGIDYSSHTISLVDPDVLEDESCPRVEHNVTVPPIFWLNFTDTIGYLLFFADCSIASLPNQTDITPIDCDVDTVTRGWSGQAGPTSAIVCPYARVSSHLVSIIHPTSTGDVDKVTRGWSGQSGAVGWQRRDSTTGPTSVIVCPYTRVSSHLLHLPLPNRDLKDCLHKTRAVQPKSERAQPRSSSLHCQPAAMLSLSHHHDRGLLLMLLLLTMAIVTSRGDATSACRRLPYLCGGVNISYPFYLASDTKAIPDHDGESYCGYPGLAISCHGSSSNKAILNLSGDSYAISSIDYTNLTVSLADADASSNGNCPTVDHNVTIPPVVKLALPISAVDYLFFFVNCSFGHPDADDLDPFTTKPKPPKPPTIKPITCGGFDEAREPMTFVLPTGDVPPGDWSGACESVFEAPVLRGAVPRDAMDPKWRSDGYGKALRDGFRLAWDRSSGRCGQCEQSGGMCGYGRGGEFLGCLCADGRGYLVANPSSFDGDVSYRALKRIARTMAQRHLALHDNAGRKIDGVTVTQRQSKDSLHFVARPWITIVFIVRKRKKKNVINSSSKLLKYSGSGGTPRYRAGGDMESGSIEDPPAHLFSYEELEEATNSFDENRELGDGGFGTDGRVVAVKRLYNSFRRLEQFQNEAAILSGLRHPNLVMFYGCTSSQSRELLLVYEFVANGTIADHLHGARAAERALSWPLRLSVAVESAAALNYLHAIEPPVVHRDVKTNNILLDADFHVKVADFGLSRLFPLDATHVSTAPQGTPGYVDPEYHQCYQLTDKSDVYSFGVVLVELISSKPAVDITRHRNEINLAGMAVNKIQKCQLEELVDLDLGYESDPATKKMMTMVAELAFRCLQQNSEMRPPMKEVLEVLRSIQGECRVEKDGDKNKDGAVSPTTVHAPWDSRATTPNTSRD
ncbi:hypothetical protein HU200_047135 [Digitaria exilis]|uniref:Protein kinase domain-containing protein n=1 Tax=Digitaria exilis TaxID=1010633 RepID=A0A835EAI9_9POAL|nr:hypothetical protein HU200_047135 [Digitaria exilis]